MKSFREKIIKYGTFLVVCFTPILFLGSSWFVPHVSPKTFFFYGVIEIIFALWLYNVFFDSSYRIPKKVFLFFIPIFLFISWTTLSGFLGINPEMSFWSSIVRGTGLLTWYHFIAFSLVCVSLFYKEGFDSYGRNLLMYFLIGSFILTISIWFGNEGFNLPISWLQNTNGGGLIGNSSISATYLLFTMFVGLFFIFLKNISKIQKIFTKILILSILFSPLFVNIYGFLIKRNIIGSARGTLLGIILGFFVAFLCYISFSKNKIYKIIGVGGLFISLIIFSFGWNQLVKPQSYIHNIFISEATGSRFIFWDIAKKALKDRPFFGWGPENYSIVYQKYFDPHIYIQSSSIEIYNDRAHNVFFETGVAGGYPAIVFYCLFLISILYGIYVGYKNGNFSRIQSSILLGLIVAYVFQNLFVFDSVSSLLGIFLVVCIVFGNVYSSESLKQKNKNINNISFLYKFCVALLLLVLFIFSWAFFVRNPVKKIRLLSSVTQMTLDKRQSHYGDLLNVSSIGDGWEVGDIAHTVYITYAKNKDQISKDPILASYVQKDLMSLLSYLEAVSQKEPFDYRLHISIARLNNLSFQIFGQNNDKSIDQILNDEYRIKELSPFNPEVDWEVAQTLLIKGDKIGVEKALSDAIILAPYIKASHQILIDFAKNTGNKTLLTKAVNDAELYVPNFSSKPQ